MPKGMYKSRTLRKIFVKTPCGKTKIQYRKRKPRRARCADCKVELSGIARERPRKMQNMTKSKKRPTRPYGGNLCSKCMRKKMIEKARSEKK